MAPLQKGDEIRVIAPSRSNRSRNRKFERARERLESLGFKVTFGKHLESVFHLGTARAEDRAKDFNEAYADKNVKAVMALNGGWSANEILPLIDWDLVAKNPKPFIGYSDITVLLNAIYAKTGQIGYLGPNFSTLGYMTEWKYSLENLGRILLQDSPLSLTRSKKWGVKRGETFATKPWKVFSKGTAEAVLLGGNLGTFYLLQGTEYQPVFNKPFIFALEDDSEAGDCTDKEVSRRFESILQLPGFRENLRGLIVGRFERESKVPHSVMESIIESKKLGNIPIITNVDFGHTLPLLTLPIGGKVRLNLGVGKREVVILSPN